MRLKIGDDFLDGDSVIAQTFAVNEIGDIQTQQGGFSNDFTIPLTAKNKSILGFPDNINSASRNPYEKVDATLFDNGVPIAEGYLRYTVASDTELEASFLSDNVNWFNLLKGKKMTDLDLSDYDHMWDLSTTKATIDADKTSGYVYPFCNYGSLYDGESLTMTSNNIFDHMNLMPGMFVHTLVDQIFFEIGWKIEGDIINHPMYKRMVLPFSAKDFVHSAQWVEDNTITATQSGDTAAAGTQTLFATYTGERARLTIQADWQMSGSNPTAGEFFLYVNGGVFVSTRKDYITPGAGIRDYFVEFSDSDNGWTSSVPVPNGDDVGVRAIVTSGPDTIVLKDGSTTKLIPSRQVFPESTIQMSATMPNIKQADFINYINSIFGGVLQANPLSKTVTWSFFRDIKNNLPNALDWSDKLDISKTREIDFTELLNKYGQESFYKYKADGTDDDVADYNNSNSLDFGDGSIDINNEHIEGVKDFYTAPFSATINVPSLYAFFNIPKIPFYEYVTQPDDAANNAEIIYWTGQNGGNGKSNIKKTKKPNPRILLMTENISLSDWPGAPATAVSFFSFAEGVSVQVTAMPFSWFAKPTMDMTDVDALIDTLAFDQVNISNVIGDPLIERFLSDYDNILNSMKYLSASLWLTEADIANLDFTIPIYLDRYKSYFYISKIEDFQGRERTTECELVKIS